MNEERDYVMNVIKPLFQKEANQYGFDFDVVDLRWGITPEEARDGRVLEICLREIDNCRPLFLGIIGNRYGWCPSYNDFINNEYLRSTYPEFEEYFKKGLSITEMEMLYGAINSGMESGALFFIKKPFLTKGNSQINTDEEWNKLQDLRTKIANDPSIESYYYATIDLNSIENSKSVFGSNLLDWLRSKLESFVADASKDTDNRIENQAPVTYQERKTYLINRLASSGKQLSPNQIETILYSKNTETPEGLESFISDLLLFGIFEELDHFIIWRANVTKKEYEEFVIQRRIKMYRHDFIVFLRFMLILNEPVSVGLFKQMHDELYSEDENYYSNMMAVQRLYNNRRNKKGNSRVISEDRYGFLYEHVRDATRNHILLLEHYDFDSLCINEEHKEFLTNLLLPDPEILERARIQLIETLLRGVGLSGVMHAYNTEDPIEESDDSDENDEDYSFYEDWPEELLREFNTPYTHELTLEEEYELETTEYEPEMTYSYLLGYGINCDEIGDLVEKTGSLDLYDESYDRRYVPEQSSSDEYDEYGEFGQAANFKDDTIWFEGDEKYGKAHMRNGDTYEGEWSGDYIANGIYECKGRYVFEGRFYNNMMRDGEITYMSDGGFYRVGDRYEGTIWDNKYDGRGTFYWADGKWLEGLFHNNKIDGEGTLHLINGDIIEGNWENGVRKGIFTLTKPDGRTIQKEYS